jgi:uncharacterized protein YndB with AHSA1/START domain
MLKILLWIVGGLAALVGAVCAVGLALPKHHVARAEQAIAAPPERVAELVREVEAQPRWRKGVTAIDVQERGEGRLRYRERSGGDVIAYLFEETAPGSTFRSTITDETLPFGGSWTITLTPAGEGTLVSIVEQGEVRNPIFRALARFVFGHQATMKAYLADLKRAAEA